jgi:hypothetical protein
VTPRGGKERPILFSGPMVRALLEGRKTQTRRLVTVPWQGGRRTLPFAPYWVEEDGRLLFCDEAGEYHPWVDCTHPYGVPGDRLWVRETWAPVDRSPRRIHFAVDRASWLRVDTEDGYRWDFRERWGSDCVPPSRLKPGIHMPRWASRITLEVTDVRVQRLQEISEDDVVAEGLDLINGDRRKQDAYAELWDDLNGKRAPWKSNPWVWAISFRRAVTT